MIEQKGLTHILTVGWWKGFKKRRLGIARRKSEGLSQARMKSSTEKVLDRYFDQLHETLTKDDLLNKPGHLFNCDESGFPLDPKTGYVVTRSIHIV